MHNIKTHANLYFVQKIRFKNDQIPIRSERAENVQDPHLEIDTSQTKLQLSAFCSAYGIYKAPHPRVVPDLKWTAHR